MHCCYINPTKVMEVHGEQCYKSHDAEPQHRTGHKGHSETTVQLWIRKSYAKISQLIHAALGGLGLCKEYVRVEPSELPSFMAYTGATAVFGPGSVGRVGNGVSAH